MAKLHLLTEDEAKEVLAFIKKLKNISGSGVRIKNSADGLIIGPADDNGPGFAGDGGALSLPPGGKQFTVVMSVVDGGLGIDDIRASNR